MNKTDKEYARWLRTIPYCYRKRGLDSYRDELKIDIQSKASKSVAEKGTFLWYDLCCGVFNAGSELVSLVQNVKVVGVDLIATTHKDARVKYVEANVLDFEVPSCDLITCCYGFMYMAEMDLEKSISSVFDWYSALDDRGTLAMNFSVNNWNSIKQVKKELIRPFKEKGAWFHDFLNTMVAEK